MRLRFRPKTVALVYVLFWVGMFGVVMYSRAVPARLPLSEVAAFAATLTGQQDQRLKESALFVSMDKDDSSIIQITPAVEGVISTRAEYRSRDAEALQLFLEKYRSPMAPYADVFVASAEKHRIDYKIVVAIAMVESGAGRVVPGNGKGGSSYNAWGWRNGEGYQLFKDWGEGIEYISWRLAEGYGRDRLKPRIMEATYCPPCAINSPGRWASGVEKYMRQIGIIYNELKD